MQARQDLRLERANVTLQALRLKEAEDGKTLANAQRQRAVEYRDHFTDLLSEPVSATENWALALMGASALFHGTAAAGAWASIESDKVVQALTSTAQAFEATSSLLSIRASLDRRKEEWKFQETLGVDDVSIADVGILLADDRIGINEQERGIADLRLENATDTVEFLQDRFTNAPLYRWMLKSLGRLYQNQLNLAISTGRAAQRALEFERQTSLDFIATDYWDAARAGLVGAERLLSDLDKMDQYRLSTSTRKKEIEKTISLASLMPAEFQRFRTTGVLDFETAMKWFDADFPGQYMRLIRDVGVTVLALIPPNESIHATLSNPGISHAMAGPPFEHLSTIYRLPESVSLSGANRATGLFELHPSDPMLFPYEGSGVATTWRLDMPKGANRFDFGNLYDVLITVRYTALEDRDYRTVVLTGMGQDEQGFVKAGAVRYFSLRNHFADQWYHLLNPIVGLTPDKYWDPTSQQDFGGKPQKPYTVFLDLKESDFVPNEERRSIKKITLAVQPADGQEFEDWEMPVSLRQGDTSGNAKLTIAQVSAPVDGFAGKRPYGRWVLCVGNNCTSNAGQQLPNRDLAMEIQKRLRDVWVIVEYQAAVHR